MAWFIIKIRFRRFTPLGQTNWHFPQNMHFCISSFKWCISPLLRKVCTLRMLKSTKFPALQVAVQLPQPIQVFTDGSCVFRYRRNLLSLWSKSIDRSGCRLYPNFFKAYFDFKYAATCKTVALASATVFTMQAGPFTAPEINTPGMAVILS